MRALELDVGKCAVELMAAGGFVVVPEFAENCRRIAKIIEGHMYAARAGYPVHAKLLSALYDHGVIVDKWRQGLTSRMDAERRDLLQGGNERYELANETPPSEEPVGLTVEKIDAMWRAKTAHFLIHFALIAVELEETTSELPFILPPREYCLRNSPEFKARLLLQLYGTWARGFGGLNTKYANAFGEKENVSLRRNFTSAKGAGVALVGVKTPKEAAHAICRPNGHYGILALCAVTCSDPELLVKALTKEIEKCVEVFPVVFMGDEKRQSWTVVGTVEACIESTRLSPPECEMGVEPDDRIARTLNLRQFQEKLRNVYDHNRSLALQYCAECQARLSECARSPR